VGHHNAIEVEEAGQAVRFAKKKARARARADAKAKAQAQADAKAKNGTKAQAPAGADNNTPDSQAEAGSEAMTTKDAQR
jgi:PiT family inorganic phosphate transporter